MASWRSKILTKLYQSPILITFLIFVSTYFVTLILAYGCLMLKLWLLPHWDTQLIGDFWASVIILPLSFLGLGLFLGIRHFWVHFFLLLSAVIHRLVNFSTDPLMDFQREVVFAGFGTYKYNLLIWLLGLIYCIYCFHLKKK